MDEPSVAREGPLRLRGRILCCTLWKRKYVAVRADTRQLAIYDKQSSASTARKRGECLIIQLRQVVECKAVETSKKRRSFYLQKSANAGAGRKIIFRCADPADCDQWIDVINDVMNGKISCRVAEFDDVVVSTEALTHLGKARPKHQGRRPPGKRAKPRVTTPTTEIQTYGEDADSGVGASSELLATQATINKVDDIEVEDGNPDATSPCQDATSPCQDATSPCQEPQTTPVVQVSSPSDNVMDIDEDGAVQKPDKMSALQRLRRKKKDGGEGKTPKADKTSSLMSRLGARISRAFTSSPVTTSGQTTEPDAGKKVEKVPSDTSDGGAKSGDSDAGSDVEAKSSTPQEPVVEVSTKTKEGHGMVIKELMKSDALQAAIRKRKGASDEDLTKDAEESRSRRDSAKSTEKAEESKPSASEAAKERPNEQATDKAKDEDKRETKDETKEGVKDDSKDIAKGGMVDDPKEKAKEDVKDKAQEEAKEGVIDDAKDVSKEGIKGDAKEEAKEGVEGDIKDQTKDDIRREDSETPRPSDSAEVESKANEAVAVCDADSILDQKDQPEGDSANKETKEQCPSDTPQPADESGEKGKEPVSGDESAKGAEKEDGECREESVVANGDGDVQSADSSAGVGEEEAEDKKAENGGASTVELTEETQADSEQVKGDGESKISTNQEKEMKNVERDKEHDQEPVLTNGEVADGDKIES
ncbi:uncharacterized protein [Diadema antillarum]|uniref:uncharacterized protein n=1 Tax=Diadema antillarum TaxID=105358 RepID=UPI003A8BEB45